MVGCCGATFAAGGRAPARGGRNRTTFSCVSSAMLRDLLLDARARIGDRLEALSEGAAAAAASACDRIVDAPWALGRAAGAVQERLCGLGTALRERALAAPASLVHRMEALGERCRLGVAGALDAALATTDGWREAVSTFRARRTAGAL